MLPRDSRLREKKLFDRVFKRGTWARGRYFSIVFLASPERGKVGFIITKKISKSAVERNRIKRRIRTALLEVMTSPTWARLFANYYMVVVIHRSAEELPFPDLIKEVESVVAKIEMLLTRT